MPSSQHGVAVGSVVIHRISAPFKHKYLTKHGPCREVAPAKTIINTRTYQVLLREKFRICFTMVFITVVLFSEIVGNGTVGKNPNCIGGEADFCSLRLGW